MPVNTGYRGNSLVYTLSHSRAQVAVVAERYLDRLADVAAELNHLKTVVVPDATEEPDHFPRVR